MGNYNTTGLDAIRDLDFAAADAFHKGDHPQAFSETAGSLVELLDRQGSATSGSSVTIETGSKVFTLDSAHDWTNGIPVYITDDANPSTNVMVGTLSADETAGVITVNVTSTKGSGTHTAWTIALILAVSTVVATPVSLADGGFGSPMNTLDEARVGLKNVDVAWTVSVRDFDVTDPTATDAWDDGDFGHVAGSGTLGAFIAHEESIFQRTSLGVFTFIDTPELRNGDQAFEGDYGVGGLNQNRRYYNSDQSKWVVKEKPPGIFHSGQITGGSNTISVTDDLPRLISFELSGVGAVLTLPVTTDWGSNLPMIILWSDDANPKTINVSGGGTINGETAFTLRGVNTPLTLVVDSVAAEYRIVSEPVATGFKVLGTNTILADADLNLWVTYIDVQNTPITITIPDVLTANKVVKIKNRIGNGGNVTVNVTGGGNINDSPTLVLTPGQTTEIHGSFTNPSWLTF